MILPRLVHHVYSKHAEVTVPSLDDWEKGWKEKLKAETLKLEMPELKVLPVNFVVRKLSQQSYSRVLAGPNRFHRTIHL